MLTVIKLNMLMLSVYVYGLKMCPCGGANSSGNTKFNQNHPLGTINVCMASQSIQ